MKSAAAQLLLVVAAMCPLTLASDATPVGKVISMLSDLQTKILGEGEEAQKAYGEFAEWCEERSKNLGFEISTGKKEVASLKAAIEQEAATIGSLSNKVEELSADLATDEADLKAATEIRARESTDFVSQQKELSEIIDTLQRAVGILEKEMAKSGASMMQLKSAGSITQALNVMVEASMLSTADVERLTALVQTSQGSEDSELGAPAAAVYKGQAGGIIETLSDLLEKAEGQLADARGKETSSLHNFELLKQSIEDEIKFGTKDLNEAKKGIASSSEKKSAAEGDLSMTSKELKSDITTMEGLHSNCMKKAEEFEAGVKSRDEELKALAAAKKAVAENTGGADSITYGLSQVSLVQLRSSSRLSTSMDLARFEAVRFIRDLAQKQHDPALAQLASRMASAVHFGSKAGDDPFAKVKGLIADMISRLQDEANADATHKAFCDKELSETTQKQEEKDAEIAKLSSKIDEMTARSAQLKEEVAALQKALAELAAAQAEMDKLRKEENTIYVKSKADMEQGIEGVKLALKILNEYYAKEDKAHAAAEGASTGIIGLLEVVESDFSKGLAEIVATEESALATYDKETKENAIEKATKDQDVKYKSAESADLDKASAELSSDRSGVQAELDSVLEYLEKIKAACIAKPETYETRTKRREAEIAGLKEALKILEGEAMLVQRSATRRTLRGVRPHGGA